VKKKNVKILVGKYEKRKIEKRDTSLDIDRRITSK
jgi:hypothetical protein